MCLVQPPLPPNLLIDRHPQGVGTIKSRFGRVGLAGLSHVESGLLLPMALERTLNHEQWLCTQPHIENALTSTPAHDR